MICDHLHFSGKGNIMDHHLAGATGVIVATSTLGGYLLDILSPIAAFLSIVWLSLQIGDHLHKKYKKWKSKK